MLSHETVSICSIFILHCSLTILMISTDVNQLLGCVIYLYVTKHCNSFDTGAVPYY